MDVKIKFESRFINCCSVLVYRNKMKQQFNFSLHFSANRDAYEKIMCSSKIGDEGSNI